MKMSVGPEHGSTCPDRAADSIRRRAVVPTGMTRPPALRGALISVAACGVTSPHSACILWVVTSSTLTGRKVPAPTCSVTSVNCTPLAASACNSASSKCSEAVGAATAPAWRAKTGWESVRSEERRGGEGGGARGGAGHLKKKKKGIGDGTVTGVQTCALPISRQSAARPWGQRRPPHGGQRRSGNRSCPVHPQRVWRRYRAAAASHLRRSGLRRNHRRSG